HTRWPRDWSSDVCSSDLHLEIIRIGSRVPGSLPERITPELCAMIKQYHPVYMNLHFNHPDELTPEVKAACGRLADAGVPLGAQRSEERRVGEGGRARGAA